MDKFAETGFLFAFDIVRTSKTPSGFEPAERHFGSGAAPDYLGDKLYGHLRIAGAAAALRLGFIKKLVIPGKDEKRYKDELVQIDDKSSPIWQGWAIREMLINDHDIDPTRVLWIPSTGTTSDAASVMKRFVDEHPDLFPERHAAFITSYYHVDRVGDDLRAVGLFPNLFAAERFILAEARSEEDRVELERLLFKEMDEPDYVKRIVAEIRGGAQKIIGAYNSQQNKRGW